MEKRRVWCSALVAVVAGLAPRGLASVRAAEGAGLVLVHEDRFGADRPLDARFWSVETGLFRNREAQSYQPGNVVPAADGLRIEARREAVANAGFRPDARGWPADVRTADYTSGSIVTRDSFTFGAFEVVARLPRGAGTWPAIWLISERGLPYREIDVVEAVGKEPGVVHTTVTAGPDLAEARSWPAETPLPTLADSFHTYRLDWRPHAIVASIDGRPVLRLDPDAARSGGWDPLREPMHLRINLALGGTWGGPIDDASLPARMEIRSVRIWRLAGTGN